MAVNGTVSYSKLFEKILLKPGMYVGNSSPIKMSIFIQGYQAAKWDSGDKATDPMFDGFTAWVADRFNIKSSHGWADIIEFMSPDHAYAWQLTKDLWAEYKAEFSKNARNKARQHKKSAGLKGSDGLKSHA